MKQILLTLVAVMSIHLSPANACSILPVNESVQINDLAAQALNHLSISIAEMDNIEVSDYYGEYIWTPMCPEGIESGAVFQIGFSVGDSEDFPSTSCIATVKVDKHHLFENSEPEYTLEDVQIPTCLARI